MNKEQLIEQVSQELKSSKAQARDSVDAVLNSITKVIKKKGLLRLIGFGSFKIKKRKARQVRNPRTGNTMKVPAKNYLSFSVSSNIKDLINK